MTLSWTTIPFFAVAIVLYALPFFLLLAKTPLLHRTAFISFAAAILTHIFGLAARIALLARPPIATLYESILYVSLVCALAAFILYHINRKTSFIQCGSLAATFLLALSFFFRPQGGGLDVLLAAVLNNNFWLVTHVIMITSGYGICIITALLAHMFLLAQARRQLTEPPPALLHAASLAALFFIAFGTVLGGIWADQSWGRFWGWDPKENGALLIVLWLIWLQHARLAGRFSSSSYAGGLAFLNVIVALSWFGVNMLGTGLHSYGFTAGTLTGLGIFCGGEIILIALLLFFAKRKNHAL